MSLEGKDIISVAKKHRLIVVCAALSLGLLGVMYWRSSAISDLQAQVDEKTLVLQKNKANAAYAVQLDAQLKALAEVNEKIKASALRAENLAQNQQMFYRMESDTGVKLIDIQQRSVDNVPKKGAAPATYSPVVFTLAVGGDYRQLVTFTKLVETGPTMSRVSGAMFSVDGSNVPSLNLTVEMLSLRQ